VFLCNGDANDALSSFVTGGDIVVLQMPRNWKSNSEGKGYI
jgi:hypothetical protein